MPFEEIGRDNVEEWLAWGFLNKGSWGAEDNDELEEFITESKTSPGRKFAPGRKTAVPMRPTLDAVNISHRPLLYYIVSAPEFSIWIPSHDFWPVADKPSVRRR